MESRFDLFCYFAFVMRGVWKKDSNVLNLAPDSESSDILGNISYLSILYMHKT